jgi:hypothetical protein
VSIPLKAYALNPKKGLKSMLMLNLGINHSGCEDL